MIYTPHTKEALRIAFEAHRGQVDKAGIDYVHHPLHVAEQMDTEEEICAALLHDILEDTTWTLEDLRAHGIPEASLKAIALLTRSDDVPYLDYVAALAGNAIAKKVKLADLRHNSDPGRLPRLDPKDIKRINTYMEARKLLGDEQILLTDRLILRPWNEADAEALYTYARDPQVGPIAGWPPHQSIEESREIIRTVLSMPETYAVVLRETLEPIGSVGLLLGDAADPIAQNSEAELGYWVGVPHWGHGYIPEAAHEVMRHAFEDLELTGLWCICDDSNTKSKRVMEKLGFVYSHTEEGVSCELMGDERTYYYTQLPRIAWIAQHSLTAYDNQ